MLRQVVKATPPHAIIECGGVRSVRGGSFPGGSVTSLPSVAAMVPPPPIRTPSTAPLRAADDAAEDRADRRRLRRSSPTSPLIPSLSSACVTVPRIG